MVAGRFIATGLACAVLHNVIMIACHFLGLHYVPSSVISFGVVVLVGYGLHSGWTFPGARRGAGSLARYALSMSANLPLFVAGLYVLVDLLGLSVPLATPLVTVLLMVFNFIATRWALRVERRDA